MTAQQHEIIILNGEPCGLATLPLTDYLKYNDDIPEFIYPHTACWRGYLGTWEIMDNKLFMVDLVCYTKLAASNELIESDISILFPGQNEVFANWFSGVLRIPNRKIINYVHAGFASTNEEDLFLKFKKGVLVDYSNVESKIDFINDKKGIGFISKIKGIIRKTNPFKYL